MLVQPQDPVALRRAAAFQRHVDEVQAEPRGGLARQRVGAVAGRPAQVDQRLQAESAGQRGEAAGGGVVAAVQPARGHRAKVAPDEAEHRVVDEQRVHPREHSARGRL